jgi:glycine dehydrogenase
VLKAGLAAGVNLRKVDASHVGISLDETTTIADVDTLLKVRARSETGPGVFNFLGQYI